MSNNNAAPEDNQSLRLFMQPTPAALGEPQIRREKVGDKPFMLVRVDLFGNSEGGHHTEIITGGGIPQDKEAVAQWLTELAGMLRTLPTTVAVEEGEDSQ